MNRCLSCGTDSADGLVYCDECGAKLISSTPPPSSAGEPSPPNVGKLDDTTISARTPPEPTRIVTAMFKRCRVCGWANLESRTHCIKCGNKIETSSFSLITSFFKALVSRIKTLGQVIARYRDKLLVLYRSRAKLAIKQTIPSPFILNRSRYEASVPLLQTFRFVHEPIGVVSTERFIGRQSEMETLAERILFSEGGSFLVTGYRGVGKTSFINQVVKKLEEALPWAQKALGETEVLDIYLNVARPVQPSEIMHHIIRRLHDRLIEKGIYNFLGEELKEALTLAYNRTSVNMVRKLAESSERSLGFNELNIGTDWMKAAMVSWSSKSNRSQNHEMSFLGYDDKSAEHDIISISRRLAAGYAKPLKRPASVKSFFNRVPECRVRLKIIFVFDELDKLEEFNLKDGREQKPVIDQILGALKNLFTTSGVTFVFVAGKDLQERWLEDVGKGDSVYESVFSYDKYLPCLWADVSSICNGLVDSSKTLRPYDRQIFDEFKKYLAYKGRGIPRRIIRTFNEYVEWNGDVPALAFTRQSIRRIRFFAGLQDVLDANEKQLFGDFHEEVVGTQSDKRRLGVYYLIDWILRQGTAEFSLKDVLKASKRLSSKIALAEEIAPNMADKIIKILLDSDYIQEVHRSLNRVIIGDAGGIDGEPTVTEKRYKIAPRRLGEMGGLAGDVEVDMNYIPATETFSVSAGRQITSVGKYKVVRKIGEGGMGAVYEAIDKFNGRRVAIKAMVYSSSDKLLARFEREAMIMNELNHPNIVRLYDWGKENERPYIAMEYLDGITLEEMIRRQRKLSLNLVVTIVKPVLEATHYLHQKGFVRNDIKPNNIMLTTSGRVCLLDFGITKPTKSSFRTLDDAVDTKTGEIIGTPHFMAPEQFMAQDVDERTDIYSLGVILYKMLTGVYPFEGSGLVYMMQAHTELSPAPPSMHIKLSPAVDTVILKCLEKDRSRRFQTIPELLQELSHTVDDLPPIDLKSVINAALIKVKEVERMDQMNTLLGVSSPSLVMVGPAARPLIVTPRGPLQEPPSSAMHTWPGSQKKIELEMRSEPVSGISSLELPGEAGPFIAFFSGRLEDVTINLISVEFGYRLEDKTSIGRSSENVIVLRDAKVSRYQAEITTDGGDWFIEDFNSSLGSFVNGERIITRRLLKDGDKIQMGDFVFVFNHTSSEQSS
jgi:serine/threonine-protein kinase